MPVKEENEITIKVTCSNNELIQLLTNKGFKNDNKNPSTLLSKNIFIANTIAMTAGNILKVVINPSLAPSKNVS